MTLIEKMEFIMPLELWGIAIGLIAGMILIIVFYLIADLISNIRWGKSKLWLKQHLCNHEFEADIQIVIIKCKKCKVKYPYTFADIYK